MRVRETRQRYRKNGISLSLSIAALITVTSPVPGETATPVKAADVLSWTADQRNEYFWQMDTMLPHRAVGASTRVLPLPVGKPLRLQLAHDGKNREPGSIVAEDHTAGLLILQNGKIRLENYGPTLTRNRHWAGFSVTKSITSALYGAAIQDGFIRSLDDNVATYLPEMKETAYDGVTIRQLLTMTSGVKWSEDVADPASDVVRMYATPADPGFDPVISYMRHLRREAAPGSHWVYKTGEADLAGMLLVRATKRPLADYLAEKIWRPYGMQQNAYWMVNEHSDSPGGCCLSAALRDFGRFGEFIRGGGKIGGKAVLAPGFLEAATSSHIHTDHPGQDYGFFWWLNRDQTFDALGLFGQQIHIDRQRNLVVVVLAAWDVPWDDAHFLRRKALIHSIEAAIDGHG